MAGCAPRTSAGGCPDRAAHPLAHDLIRGRPSGRPLSHVTALTGGVSIPYRKEPIMAKRLTGFQPTGHLHLGNLLGAMRPLVLAQDEPGEAIAMIADLHAMTAEHDPQTLRDSTLGVATLLLAAGVDPKRTMLIAQSQIPEHAELHYLLECTTGYGEAARMTQFKEKSAVSRTPGFSAPAPGPGAGGKQSGPVRLSLLTYPVLMAADILVHDA